MSDLISRSMYKSKLLKALDVLNKEYREAILNEDNDLILAIQNQQSAYMIALRLLDNEPTAYDIDKVFEELEISVNEANNNCLCEMHENGHTLDFENENGRIKGLKEAIEIVKQGGVGEDISE